MPTQHIRFICFISRIWTLKIKIVFNLILYKKNYFNLILIMISNMIQILKK